MKTQWVVLIVMSAIAGTFLLTKAFGPSQKIDTKFFDLYMESKDREARLEREWRISNDSIHKVQLAEARQQDTIYINNSKQNAQKIANIPARVNSLSDDELTRAINERYPD